ncbi:MAG: diguanylate cyclase [Candidatus Pacebacteria bacterium]|nr:diguanylate cyclase [Candidatus Paceibacterota bacterium]
MIKEINVKALRSENRRLKEKNKALKREIKRLKKIEVIDPLTNVFNRRAFHSAFENACKEITKAARNNKRKQKPQYSLILIDIDDFKELNDAFGHLFGDKILKQFGQFLQSMVRSVDGVFRWGGEEFAIILHNIDLDQAQIIAEDIQVAARIARMPYFCAGVTQCYPGVPSKETFNKADRALYEAKRRGKNQVQKEGLSVIN